MRLPVHAPFVFALAAVLSASGAAQAQPYARFAVPDSVLVPAVLSASGAGFETAWNALLVAECRATAARADSAPTLRALAGRVARAETEALGTRIAADALALRRRWSPAQCARRVAAAGAEAAGTAAQQGARWAESDSLFGAALAGYRALGERRREAVVLGSAGSTWFLAGDYPRADSLYRRALGARRALGDSLLVGRALNTLGSIAYLERRFPEAYELFQRTRALREQIGDRAGLVATLNYLGLVTTDMGRRDEARACYEQALELAAVRGDSTRVAEALGNLANLLRESGDLERAEAVNRRAMVIARERQDDAQLARLRINLGNVLRLQGRFTESAAAVDQAVRQSEAAGDPRGLLQSLLTLGVVRLDLKDPDSSRPPLLRAVALADSLGDAYSGIAARNDLAIALRLAGDEQEGTRVAQRGFDQAAAGSDSESVARLATTLGQFAGDRGDLAAARRWFERAASASRALGVDQRVTAFHNLGYVAGVGGRTDECERLFRESLELAQSAGLSDRLWSAMLGLGDVAERRGDFATALDWDRRAATLIDTLRTRQREERSSITLFSGGQFAYEALIHLLGRLDARFPDSAYAAEAFQWSERARARAFLDLVRAAGGAAAAVAPLSLEQARALLRSDREALLAYSLGDSSSSLWVVTRRAWKRFALPPRPALRARAEILRRGLADPVSAEERRTRAAARALYQALVAPAEPLLKGVTHLVVAPDGPLALVPFEALLARDVPEGAPAPRGAYLVERWEVSYTPSATALATRAGSAAARGIVALGDARFAPDSGATPVAEAGAAAAEGGAGVGGAAALAPLPNTAAEVAALRALAGTRPVETLTGAAATRANLLAALERTPAQLVHLATHGEANEVEPQRSGLWLAWDGAAPGFLSVRDVLGLRLGADLVTLSACETGTGRLERGEGVLGLARAFLAAGSRSVVVSLWKVNDRSTAALMERFYRPLLTKGVPRETALAAAKRALLADPETRSPFHWAPFVLVGASGPVR